MKRLCLILSVVAILLSFVGFDTATFACIQCAGSWCQVQVNGSQYCWFSDGQCYEAYCCNEWCTPPQPKPPKILVMKAYFYGLDAPSFGSLPVVANTTGTVDLLKTIGDRVGVSENNVYLRNGMMVLTAGEPTGDASKAISVGDSGFGTLVEGLEGSTTSLTVCTFTQNTAFTSTTTVDIAWGQTYIFPLMIGQQRTAVALRLELFSDEEFAAEGEDIQIKFSEDVSNHRKLPGYKVFMGSAPGTCTN